MATPPLPPLAAIRAFEAAARHQSFTRAAEELGMTQAAVSYQIKVLEDRVGALLFARGPRGVSLTETGRRLVPGIAESFTLLRSVFSELAEASETILKISALTTFATNWLVPRLGAFQLKHPEIAVRLETSNALTDLASEDVDIGIRSGRGPWPGLVAHGLFPAAFTPMLNPRLLENAAPLREPADILRLHLIDPADVWWQEWFSHVGVTVPDLSRRSGMRLQTQQLAGRAALAGQGVAILTPAFFSDELASGQLVQPFPFVRQSADKHYWLVYAEARRRSRKVRAFCEWILSETGATA